MLTNKLFLEHPDIRAQEASRYDHILVDEYQDTNDTQYQIVKALAGHRNLCVVGDDDQSIYGFRGAEVEHILSFARDWPDAKVIRLEENYRSTERIIEFANTLIKFNTIRNDKVLHAARPNGERPQIKQYENETVEARETVFEIRDRIARHRREPRDFAILFRTNEQPRVFETELRKEKLPYVLVGGQSFFDRKEVKDVFAYLRFLAGAPDDVSVLRVINTPPRGVGKSSVEKLIEHAVTNKIPIWDLVTGKANRPSLPPAATRGLDNLARSVFQTQNRTNPYGTKTPSLFESFEDEDAPEVEVRSQVDRVSDSEDFDDSEFMSSVGRIASPDCTLVDRARSIITKARYRSEIERNYDDPTEREARWVMVEQVVNALAEYEQETSQPDLNDFLDKLILGEKDFTNDKEKQLGKNAIMLMTIHSSKGLEFPEVYLVGMEEGILPHHRALQNDEADLPEERRLCYVGVTRAEERLTLSMALTRKKWGKPHASSPSRFLYELTGKAEHPNYARRRDSE